MKIACVGGGPAGLYFAISMKVRDSAHEIHVFERNRPDDTFGRGVVFPDQTVEDQYPSYLMARRVRPLGDGVLRTTADDAVNTLKGVAEAASAAAEKARLACVRCVNQAKNNNVTTKRYRHKLYQNENRPTAIHITWEKPLLLHHTKR